MNKSIKKYIYIIYFFVLASSFALIYYGSYYYALNNMKSDNIITKEDLEVKNPGIRLSEADAVSDIENITITNDTSYVVELYNVDTNETKQSVEPIPVEFMGFTRINLIDFLSTYSENSTDFVFINYQLVSFSSDKVVIRKSYREKKAVYNYYVKAENGLIVIYKSNKITKYFETGIKTDGFDEGHQKELAVGFYIETIHDLYNYLEGITT